MYTLIALLENHRGIGSMMRSESVKHTNSKAKTKRETSGKAVGHTNRPDTGWLDWTDGKASNDATSSPPLAFTVAGRDT